jgi:phosphoglycerate dehydrogenase-like enzyme
MDNLNVVVAFNIPDEFMRLIEAVDPHIRVKNAGALFRVERQVEEQHGKATPEQAATLKELANVLKETEVMYTLRLPKNIAELAPKLKWVQFVTAGVESVLEAKGLGSSVVVTNASGSQAPPVAEHTILFMLMLIKQARRSLASQAAGKWDRFFPEELAGKTLGIIGLGRNGLEVARLAKAFNMKILAATKPEEVTNPGAVDKIYPPSQLKTMLPECDFVAVSVPLVPETTRMIGEAEFRAMKRTAFFINTARGPVIDQAALIKVLKEGVIAGAAVDVTDPEPLPPGHELFSVPNMIVTAHVSGGTYTTGQRAVQLFCDNLKKYIAHKPLVNVVDRARGY